MALNLITANPVAADALPCALVAAAGNLSLSISGDLETIAKSKNAVGATVALATAKRHLFAPSAILRYIGDLAGGALSTCVPDDGKSRPNPNALAVDEILDLAEGALADQVCICLFV